MDGQTLLIRCRSDTTQIAAERTRSEAQATFIASTSYPDVSTSAQFVPRLAYTIGRWFGALKNAEVLQCKPAKPQP